VARRALAQDGIALTTAMMVILLLAMVTTVMTTAALNVNDTSSRDRDSKRALGAAEAGMNTALQRLDRLLPLDAQCLADGPIAAQAAVGNFVRAGASVQVDVGQCAPSSDERAGNGGRFYYYVSPALSATANGCNNPTGVGAGAGRASLLASGLVVLERCVTSVGVVNGVTRRVQRRAYSALQLFRGITADSALDVSSGAQLGTTQANTNGQVKMTNAAYSGQIVRQRKAKEPVMDSVTGAWTSTTTEVPFPLAPVDPVPHVGDTNPSDITCVGPVLDALCLTNQPYDSATKTLTVRSGYAVTLAPGDYYFCDVAVEGGSLVVTGGTDMFVDRPGHSGSACPAATGGTVSVTGGIVNPVGALTAAAVAPNLRFYVYGTEGGQDVTVSAGSTTSVNALFYAPVSNVVVEKKGAASSGPVVTGAISASRLDVKGHLTTLAGLLNLNLSLDPASLTGLYRPGDWVECESRQLAGMPHSKCRS
jgi:hypothetical protein